MTPDLTPLLRPASVAVVGASETSWYGRLVLSNLMAMGFAGKIYPINPRYEQVLGLKCYPSLRELPERPDCAVLAVGREQSLAVIEEGAELGLPAAVLFASGFAEAPDADGRERHARLAALAQAGRIRICGPNCLGLVNATDRIALYGGPNPQNFLPGNVAAVMQSGANAISFGYALVERRIGLSHLITCGNQLNVDVADYVNFLVDDPNTQVIAMYLEGLSDGPKFLRVAERALAVGKPLVVLKVGRSEKGRQAAIAHTGSLAGNDAIYRGVFKQKGIAQVFDFDEMVETVALLSRGRYPAGDGVAVVTISGGGTTVFSDLGEEIGLGFPDFTPVTREALTKILPAYAPVGNPFDSTGAGIVERKSEVYQECLRLVGHDPNVAVVVAAQDARASYTAAGKGHNELFQDIAASVVAASEASPALFVCASPVSGELDTDGHDRLRQAGVPLLQGMRETLVAVKHLMEYGRRLYQRRARPALPEQVGNGRRPTHLDTVGQAGRRILTEPESKAILQAYGIPITREGVARSATEAARLAGEIGYPVALKVVACNLAHKTEAGGVRLNIADEVGLRRSYGEILQRVQVAQPDVQIEGVLVQEMVQDGLEAIAGISHDPAFGPVLAFGLGGIFTEILSDVVFRLPPLGEAEALELLESLRAYRVLRGARMKPRDVAALASTLVQLGRLAMESSDVIAELDINPLFVLPEGRGVLAGDALIILKSSAAMEGSRHEL